MKLEKKIALITGAGGGIGRALAIELAQAGVLLALCDWNEKGLQETISIIGKTDNAIISKVFDIANKEINESFIDETINHFGGIDVLVNNAGVSLGRYSIEEVKYDDMDWLFAINLLAPIISTKYAIPHLKKRPSACVVFLSSAFGLAGITDQFPYCITKFGIRGLGESLRMELEETNVNILNVHPGGIKTDIVRNGRFKEEEADELINNFDNKLAKTSAEAAAKQIKRAIETNKQRLLIGKDAKALDLLVRLMPVKYSKVLNKLMKRTLE